MTKGAWLITDSEAYWGPFQQRVLLIDGVNHGTVTQQFTRVDFHASVPAEAFYTSLEAGQRAIEAALGLPVLPDVAQISQAV